jgi:hypothetical protein
MLSARWRVKQQALHVVWTHATDGAITPRGHVSARLHERLTLGKDATCMGTRAGHTPTYLGFRCIFHKSAGHGFDDAPLRHAFHAGMHRKAGIPASGHYTDAIITFQLPVLGLHEHRRPCMWRISTILLRRQRRFWRNNLAIFKLPQANCTAPNSTPLSAQCRRQAMPDWRLLL